MTSPVFYAPQVAVLGHSEVGPVSLRAALSEGSAPQDGDDLTTRIRIDHLRPTLVQIVGEEAKHAVRVQRLKPGADVDLVDGLGLRAKGKVTEDPEQGKAGGRGETVFTVEVLQVQDHPPARPGLTLVQALAKNGRDEQAIETATELGVGTVVPWQAERCIVRWDSRKKPTRWQRILLAAMKQSRRATLPALTAAVTSNELAERIRQGTLRGELVLVCHESAAQKLSAVLTDEGLDERQEVTVIVGPEGGITDSELQELMDAGAKPVLLGPHVLRSSTAGPAALAAINLAAGNW